MRHRMLLRAAGLIATILSFALCTFSSGLDAAENPCRVIVHSGKVRVVGNAGERFIETDGNVTTGERVQIVTEDGIAYVLSGFRAVRLKPFASLQIDCSQGPGPADSAGQRLARVMDHLMMQKRKMSEPLGHKGDPSKEDESRLKVLFPGQETKLLDVRPSFAWSQSSSIFEVTVALADTENVLWKRVVAGVSMLAYPPDVSPLQRGKIYAWEIKDLARPLSFHGATFQVVGEAVLKRMMEERQKVRATCDRYSLSSENCSLAMAGFYSEQGFTYESIQILLREQEQGRGALVAPILHRLLDSSID